MTWIDFMFLAFIGYLVVRGFFRGITGELLSLAGVIGGFYLAFLLAKPIGLFMAARTDFNPHILIALSGALVYAWVVMMCAASGRSIREMLARARLSFFDNILGVAAGLVKALVVIIFVFIAGNIVSPAMNPTWMENSFTMRKTAEYWPTIAPIIDHFGFIRALEPAPLAEEFKKY